MEQFFADLLEKMSDIPAFWGYALVFFIAWFENIFPPIPGDVMVVFAGYLAAIGSMALFPVIVYSTLGGTLGFICMYYAGRFGGTRLLESRFMRWLPGESISKVQNWIHSWGYFVVAANRFLSGARTVIAFTVGMTRMPSLPVGLLAFLSSAVWVTLITLLGYMLGEEWERVVSYLSRYGQIISVLISLFLGWQLYKAILRFHKKV